MKKTNVVAGLVSARKEKGITIVSLIITIILMLILLGVSVKLVTDGKLIGSAEDAVNKTNDKAAQQQGKVDELMGTLTDIENNQKLQEEVRRLRDIIKEKQTTETGEILEVLEVESEYDRILRVDTGELTYKVSTNITANERSILEQMRVPVSKIDSQNVECSENPTIYYIADEKNIEKYNAENIGTLMEFRDLVNGNTFNYEEARLVENIYLNCDETNQWVPIGTSTYKFTKIFDGQKHTISGIYINKPEDGGQGIFGDIESSTIKDVGIINGTITCKEGAGLVGGVAGKSTIKRCYNEVSVVANSLASGIVGKVGSNTVVSECYNKGVMTTTNSSSSWVSGIVAGNNGILSGVEVINCYNVGEINGAQIGAGIATHFGSSKGTIQAKVTNCYNLGNVTSSYCGGSVFGMNYVVDLRDCFGLTGTFSSVSSYNNTSYGAKVTNCLMKSENEMKSAEFVTILNTLTETVTDEETGEETIVSTPQDVWVQDTKGINDGYPILKWQVED